jgi:Xaa-Pro aminopeptidase
MTDFAARLANLRNEMDIFGVDGFIIPRSDEHQGEYVAPCSERLSWISGFTGSAGMAIVLKETAAVFIDGRYTVQVTKEVDGDLFDYRHISNDPADQWLEDQLSKGMILSYDPWLHTGPSLHRLRQACEKVGAKLKAAPHNFIDAIWTDRPDAPLDPIVVHDVKYAGQSHEEKLAQVSDKLRAENQDAMVLSLPDSIAWLFNIRGSDIPCTPVGLGFAIVYASGIADLFMDERKIGPDVKDHLGTHVSCLGPDEFGQRLDDLSGKSVRLDGASAPKWVHDRLKKSDAVIQLGDDLCLMPKACKNLIEVQGMRNAHKRDGATMVRFLKWLSEQPIDADLNEMAVSNKLDSLRAVDPLFHDLSFPTISGAGENGAIVHYRVSNDSSIALVKDSLYLVDSGGQYLDGTTDITRTIAIGTPSTEMKDRFTRVLKGHIALSMARFPIGTTGSQLDVLARHALWQGGYDYDHGTGHGVGSFLGVHEGPQRISKMYSKVALDVGMVISNEPGYYKNGAYGIRIENLICVKKSDIESDRDMLEFEELTLCPIDVKAIDQDLLNETEKTWLNSYHQRVYDELSPLLDQEEQVWLKEATRVL